MKKNLSRASICLAIAILLIGSGRLTSFAASTITVDASVAHQVIDGFGASDAFKTSAAIHGTSLTSLSEAQTQEIMDLLFSTTKGAGLNIIRHEVGSGNGLGGDGDVNGSIASDAPSSPTAKLTYKWDANDPRVDNDQVWFSKAAMAYGKMTFIADAWSAPYYMKSNGTLKNGGYLCGVPNQKCDSGDWRQAYADYLTQYAKFYHEAGIDLAYIGYINEPDFAPTSYTGMNFDAENVPSSNGGRGAIDTKTPQNIDFIKNFLGPTLAASGLTTKVLCCDATSWDHADAYATGILADAGAAKYLGLVTGHGYYSNPNGLAIMPIAAAAKANLHTWETETATFDPFKADWDDDSDASGFQWAQNIWTSLTSGNVNAYLYWWFAAVNATNSDNEGLINLNGSHYTVSKRLWAFGNYSRFIHPGATRIDAKTADKNINVSAFKNTDGTYAVVVLNGNKTDTPVAITLQNVTADSAVPYVTNNDNNLAAQASIPVSSGVLTVTVPARSLVTYVIGNGIQAPTEVATP